MPHAREVCLVLLCAIHISSGLLLSPSAALSPSAQRALPRRVRVSHLVAAEEDDLLASFRQSTEPTKDQALKQAESLRDDDEPEILEPTLQELVAKMPQYEKVRRRASALLLSPSPLSWVSPCPTGHHRSRCRAISDLYPRLDRPLIHACSRRRQTQPTRTAAAYRRRNTACAIMVFECVDDCLEWLPVNNHPPGRANAAPTIRRRGQRQRRRRDDRADGLKRPEPGSCDPHPSGDGGDGLRRGRGAQHIAADLV